MTIDEALQRLTYSPFRSKFKLSEKDKEYINVKGLDTIRIHAAEFIRIRLAPAASEKDGTQTPFKGHPVFIAQHACACCCRKCLYKWYKVPENIDLNDIQQKRIVNLLMEWIQRNI